MRSHSECNEYFPSRCNDMMGHRNLILSEFNLDIYGVPYRLQPSTHIPLQGTTCIGGVL